MVLFDVGFLQYISAPSSLFFVSCFENSELALFNSLFSARLGLPSWFINQPDCLGQKFTAIPWVCRRQGSNPRHNALWPSCGPVIYQLSHRSRSFSCIWMKVLHFNVLTSCPKDELHQRFIGLYGEHIIPAIMHRYTQGITQGQPCLWDQRLAVELWQAPDSSGLPFGRQDQTDSQ